VKGEEAVSTGQVVLVERLFDAFAARDEDALLAIMDPEIEFFGPTATVLNEGKCYRGHDGMRRYLQDVETLWAELKTMPSRFREVGNHVVVMGRVKARARDGLEIDGPAAWVWRVEDNMIAWGCVYGDREAMPRSLQEDGRGEYSVGSRPGTRPATAATEEHLSRIP
jgi:ketosteroid isomerase-like protein